MNFSLKLSKKSNNMNLQCIYSSYYHYKFLNFALNWKARYKTILNYFLKGALMLWKKL